MKPIEVKESNKWIVWGRLYGHVVDIPKPKFEIGDRVRLLHLDTHMREAKNIRGVPFKKYYEGKYGKVKLSHTIGLRDLPTFSDVIFTIKKVLLGDPTVYKLVVIDKGDVITVKGRFYGEELSLVR